MFEGVNSYIANNHDISPISDIGGRKVLGMGGSLSGYINTGNQYHKDYFVKSQDNNKATNNNSNNKFSKLKKIVKPLLAAAAIIGGVFAFKKIGGKKGIASLLKKIAPDASSNDSGIITKIRKKIGDFADYLNTDSMELRLKREDARLDRKFVKAENKKLKKQQAKEYKRRSKELKRNYNERIKQLNAR